MIYVMYEILGKQGPALETIYEVLRVLSLKWARAEL